jgi:predicted ATPase/transcriptional regulator with XRE-family HTH domain
MVTPERDTGFGARLREARTRAVLTQGELAKRANLGIRTIARLESSRAPAPQLATQRLLAQALDLDSARAHWLFTGEGAPDGEPSLPVLPANSPLVGREELLATIGRALDDPATRLLTLTGPGGVGKTSLAFETARARAAWSGHPVHVVLLAELTDPGDVLPAVARALGLHLRGSDVRPLLARALANDPRLLVVDNLEHLLGAATDLAWLLRAAPRLTILATSREALRLAGERVLVIEPLDTGSVYSPAASLFIERAGLVNFGFDPGPEERDAIGALCERLAGLPLAIELAASQMDVLAPDAMLTLLEQAGLRSLPPNAPGTPPHQATMSGTIAWSWRLLTPVQQRLMRAAAVFAGGFTTAAIGAVLADVHDLDPAVATADAAALLPGLLRAHLLRQQVPAPGDDAPRFTMLEPIRDFVRDLLRESGNESSVSRAHASWALSHALALQAGLRGPDGSGALDRMERDHPNLRAALDWTIAAGEGELLGNLVYAIWPLWQYRDHSDEALRRLERALDTVPDMPPDSRGFLYFFGAEIAWRRGDLDLVRLFSERLLALSQELGSPVGIASANLHLSMIAPDELYRTTAIALIREAQAIIAPDLDWDPPFLHGWAALRLGIELHRAGDLQGARAALEQADALRRHAALPGAGGHLGLVRDDLGEPLAAAQAITDDLRVAATLGDRWIVFHLAWRLLLVMAPHAARDAELAEGCAALLAALAAERDQRGYPPVTAEEARLTATPAAGALPPAPVPAPTLADAITQATARISRLPGRSDPRPGARLDLPPLA